MQLHLTLLMYSACRINWNYHDTVNLECGYCWKCVCAKWHQTVTQSALGLCLRWGIDIFIVIFRRPGLFARQTCWVVLTAVTNLRTRKQPFVQHKIHNAGLCVTLIRTAQSHNCVYFHSGKGI